MKFSKAVGIYIAADILCMFIDLTMSVVDSPLIKAVNAVCSAGIMAVFIANYALTTEAEDRKNALLSGKTAGAVNILSPAAGLLLIPLSSWGILMYSLSGSPDFYRWHKILNAAFLRIFNYIENDASSSALSTGEVLLMLPCAFVPAIVYLAVYMLAGKGIISEK